jgi:hypothetical protein
VTDKAFVIMQVGARDSAERKRADEVYNFIIGPALREHGLEPIRADLDPTPGPITAKMLSDLVNSSLVIVDLTGRNPNVFYELGIAHAFARPMIAIADSVKNLPFDAKDERVIEIGAYVEGGLTYAQGESAKASLDASLRVVLAEGYVAPTPLREVAGTQSLDALAPENPLASEIGQIKETLDEVRAMVRATRSPNRLPITIQHDIEVMRQFIASMMIEMDIPDTVLSQLTDAGTSTAHDTWVEGLLTALLNGGVDEQGEVEPRQIRRTALSSKRPVGVAVPSWAESVSAATPPDLPPRTVS